MFHAILKQSVFTALNVHEMTGIVTRTNSIKNSIAILSVRILALADRVGGGGSAGPSDPRPRRVLAVLLVAGSLVGATVAFLPRQAAAIPNGESESVRKEFEAELDKGKPVTLVGETGWPKWFRLVCGKASHRMHVGARWDIFGGKFRQRSGRSGRITA